MTSCLNRLDADREGVEGTPIADPMTVALWLNAAIAAVGSADAVAAELGMSDKQLSDMRCGRRPISIARLVPWLRRDHAAGLAFVNSMCAHFGYQPTERLPEISPVLVRRSRELRRQLREEFPDEDTDVIHMAFEADTAPHRLAEVG